MNIIDYILIAFVLYFVSMGIYRGFIREVFSLLSLMVGLYVAYVLGKLTSDVLSTYIPNFEFTLPLCYLLLFIFTALIINYLGKLITKGLKLFALGTINRMIGGLFGLLKSLVLISFAWYLLSLFIVSLDLESNIYLEKSKFIPIIDQVTQSLTETILSLH